MSEVHFVVQRAQTCNELEYDHMTSVNSDNLYRARWYSLVCTPTCTERASLKPRETLSLPSQTHEASYKPYQSIVH